MPAKYARDLAEYVHGAVSSQAKGAFPSLHTLEELFEQLHFASLQKEEVRTSLAELLISILKIPIQNRRNGS